jgi:hypothetical protein
MPEDSCAGKLYFSMGNENLIAFANHRARAPWASSSQRSVSLNKWNVKPGLCPVVLAVSLLGLKLCAPKIRVAVLTINAPVIDSEFNLLLKRQVVK